MKTFYLLLVLLTIFDVAMCNISHSCNCEENAITQCRKESTTLAAKTCTTKIYSICLEKCFPQQPKPANDCDCRAYAIYRCTEATSLIAQECRSHFDAQCQHRCELERSIKHFRSKEIAHQLYAAQRTFKNMTDYYTKNSEDHSNQNATTYYAFVDCKQGNDSGIFSTNLTEAPTWKTLQYALNSIINFSTSDPSVSFIVYIMPGTYNASAQIKNRNFSLIANSSTEKEPPLTPNVRIVPKDQNNFFIKSTESSVYLKGLLITNFTATCLCLSNVNVTLMRSHFVSNTILTENGILISATERFMIISNCTFQNNSFNNNIVQAGAVYSRGGSISITDSHFISNIIGDKSTPGIGGAVRVENSTNAIISGNTFKNNFAQCGGALQIGGNSNSTIEHNFFIGNSANWNEGVGGAININGDGALDFCNNTFRNNKASQGSSVNIGQNGNKRVFSSSYFYSNCASGFGALFLSSPSSVIGCIFEDNSAIGGGGGAISACAETEIHNCTFSSNNSPCGGALLVQLYTFLISNSSFISNSASNFGGAIHNQQGSVTVQHNSIFKANQATYFGGAIASLGILNCSDSDFCNNSAIQGGAVYIDNATTCSTISSSNFTSNNSSFFGGAIFVTTSQISLHSNSFIDNNSLFGGAIATTGISTVNSSQDVYSLNSATNGGIIYLDSNGKVNCENAFISNNFVDSNGGAIYCFENCQISILNKSKFINNSAENFGGGIYIKGGNLNISDSHFKQNKATVELGGIGGVIWCDSTQINIQSSYFTNNSATASAGVIYLQNYSPSKSFLTSQYNTWEQNSAGEYGSVWFIVGNISICVLNDTFNGNRAVKGSTLTLCNITKLNITKNTLFKNNYGSQGSSINCQSYSPILSTIEIDSSTFKNNFADQQGGSIFTRNCSLQICYSRFSNNKANGDGGSIYFSSINQKLLIENSNFNDNESRQKGGSIHLNFADQENSYSSVNITLSNFTNDSANYGGSISMELNGAYDGSIKIESCSFLNASSIGDGGAIYFSGSFVNERNKLMSIDETTFKNCSSCSNGGAIYLTNKQNNSIIETDNSVLFIYNSVAFVNSNFKTKFTSNISSSSFSVLGNNFTGCKTMNGGGTIYWNNNGNCQFNSKEMMDMKERNSFYSCSALYGNETASPPFYVNITSKPHLIFNQFQFSLSFSVLDFYNDQVHFRNNADQLPQIQLSENDFNNSALTTPFPGNKLAVQSNGTLNFNGIQQQGTKGEDYCLNITLIQPNSNQIIKAQTVLHLLGCPLGYGYSTPNCDKCSSRYYSFNSKCLNCPKNSYYSQNENCTINNENENNKNYNEYQVADGYWVLNNTSNVVLLKCTKYSNCAKFNCSLQCNQTTGNNQTTICSPTCFPKNSSTEKEYERNYGYGFCEEGYQGFLCSDCSKNYYRSYQFETEHKCIHCSNTPSKKIKIEFGILIAIASLLVIFVILFPKNIMLLAFTQIALVILYLMFGVGKLASVELLIILTIIILVLSNKSDQNRGASGLIKTTIFYFQIISVLPTIWPTQVQYEINKITSLFAFNINFNGIECSFSQTDNREIFLFSFKMILPIIIILSVMIIIFLQRIISPRIESLKEKIKTIFNSNKNETLNINNKFEEEEEEEDLLNEGSTEEEQEDNDEIKNEKNESWKDTILRIILFVIYISHFDLTKAIFSIFNCEYPFGFDSEQGLLPKYISRMPWIICRLIPPGEYLTLFILSILFTIIYVFGIPFLFSMLLFFNRKKIYDEEERIAWFSFYYQNYKLNYYWFELVWMLRRTLLAFLFNVLSNNINIQALLIISTLCGFIIANQYLLPFRTRKENIFELICSVVLLITFIGSFTNQQNSQLFIWLVFAINFTFVVSIFISLFYPSLKRLFGSEKFKKYCRCCCSKNRNKPKLFVDDVDDVRKENEYADFDNLGSDYEAAPRKYKMLSTQNHEELEKDIRIKQLETEKEQNQKEITLLKKENEKLKQL
jgi:predicted outer membrane repeat protein